MFSLSKSNKPHLIGMLKSVQADNNDSGYWQTNTKTPTYPETYNGFWSKLEVPEEACNNGSCYIRITADSEIEFEFSDDESTELENGGILAWIISG